jgi:hypothetical protein
MTYRFNVVVTAAVSFLHDVYIITATLKHIDFSPIVCALSAIEFFYLYELDNIVDEWGADSDEEESDDDGDNDSGSD